MMWICGHTTWGKLGPGSSVPSMFSGYVTVCCGGLHGVLWEFAIDEHAVHDPRIEL